MTLGSISFIDSYCVRAVLMEVMLLYKYQIPPAPQPWGVSGGGVLVLHGLKNPELVWNTNKWNVRASAFWFSDAVELSRTDKRLLDVEWWPPAFLVKIMDIQYTDNPGKRLYDLSQNTQKPDNIGNWLFDVKTSHSLASTVTDYLTSWHPKAWQPWQQNICPQAFVPGILLFDVRTSNSLASLATDYLTSRHPTAWPPLGN